MQQGRTVGQSRLDILDRDLSAGTGAVFNYASFRVVGAQFDRDAATQGVRGAAGSKAGDDLGSVDLCLCLGVPAKTGKQRGSAGGLNDLTT